MVVLLQVCAVTGCWQEGPLGYLGPRSALLTHLFQQSLSCGSLPCARKHAYIAPIFKKGSKADPKIYCPISLTSLISKDNKH